MRRVPSLPLESKPQTQQKGRKEGQNMEDYDTKQFVEKMVEDYKRIYGSVDSYGVKEWEERIQQFERVRDDVNSQLERQHSLKEFINKLIEFAKMRLEEKRHQEGQDLSK